MRNILSRCLLLIHPILFLFFAFSLHAAEDPGVDGHADGHKMSSEEIVRGERLFYGLVYRGEKSVNCASCHNVRINQSDTVNWNPNAYEISSKYASLEAAELEKVLLNPAGRKLSEVHKGIDLSPEDIAMIRAYMGIVAEEGLTQPKPVINRLLIFIILLVINLFFIADLAFLKKINPKIIHLVIILGTGFFLTKFMVEDAIAIGRSKDYSPDQPIKFSHAIHVNENKTECLYCHASAEYSKSAGIPGTHVCMNCHLIVRNGTNSGSWEINKVVSSYENEIPIEWIRIHNNPDHVYFNHAQHYTVGGVECQECHGEVEAMDRVVQVSDLSMGWCIECHRESEVGFHTNEFYSNYKKLMQKVKEGEVNAVTVEQIGGLECMKCHY